MFMVMVGHSLAGWVAATGWVPACFLSDFCSVVIIAKVESRFVGCRRSAMGSAPRRPIRGLRDSSCPPPPWPPIKQIGDTGTRSDKTIICIICKQKTMVDGIQSNPPIRGLSTLSTSLTSWHKIIQKYHICKQKKMLTSKGMW